MNEHLMTNPAEVKTFALAGNARLTLRSKATGARYSYRVKASDDAAVHFVSVLTSPDNENGYSYLGIVGKDGAFRRTAKSKIAEEAPSAKAFAWFWKLVEAGKLNDALEVWHEGRCGRCARVLTVPESIANGIGPECAKIVFGEAPSLPFDEPNAPSAPTCLSERADTGLPMPGHRSNVSARRTPVKITAVEVTDPVAAKVADLGEPDTVAAKVADLEERGYRRMSLTELAAAFESNKGE